MRNTVGAFVLMIVAVLGVVWAGDILMDRSVSITVVAETPMYALPPQGYPASNPQVATLRPGEAVKVTRTGHGKDFEAFRVESSSGVSGWVVGGRGVRRNG